MRMPVARGLLKDGGRLPALEFVGYGSCLSTLQRDLAPGEVAYEPVLNEEMSGLRTVEDFGYEDWEFAHTTHLDRQRFANSPRPASCYHVRQRAHSLPLLLSLASRALGPRRGMSAEG